MPGKCPITAPPLSCTVLHCTVPYCTVLYCTVLYCPIRPLPRLCEANVETSGPVEPQQDTIIIHNCTVLWSVQCTVLYWLYCTVLLYCAQCTVLYCRLPLTPQHRCPHRERWSLYSSVLLQAVLYCKCRGVHYGTPVQYDFAAIVMYCVWIGCQQTVVLSPVLVWVRATLYCTVLYCTVLYCTVLYCTALHCTVL
jgi:hypothetical protein